MKKLKLPIWLIGGIIATALCVLFIGCTFFAPHFYATDELILWLLPILWVIGLSLSYSDLLGTGIMLWTIIAIVAQILMYFILGVAIGFFVQKAKNLHFRIAIVSLVVLSIIGIIAKVEWQERQFYIKTFHIGFTFEDCDMNKGRSGVANCYADVYDKFPPSVKVCKKIRETSSTYAECAGYVGKSTGDIDLCREFEDKAFDRCMSSIPIFTKTNIICNQIKNAGSRDLCQYNAALASGDSSFCEEIKDAYSLAWWTKTACMKQVCRVLTDEKAQADCYLNTAIHLQDD